MAIFDIEKKELLNLSDICLEELIERLAEAEVKSMGYSASCVDRTGSINSADGGVDVRVIVPEKAFASGFIARPNTIFQAKIHKMPPSKIIEEMTNEKGLLPVITDQIINSGSYIIVSLKDDCSPTQKEKRIQSMREAVQDTDNSDDIHLDFYDSSKLAQWLRQHPSVCLWVNDKIGRASYGWQPYTSWSNPPKTDTNSFITAPGIIVRLPLEKAQTLSIEDAIEPMRDLIRSTDKAVRIVGMSGVGKTRIIEALFDEKIGIIPLDYTKAVYTDIGKNPTPSASAMLDRLVAENRDVILIIDNCSAKLHAQLAEKISASETKIRLITVEYDINDDQPLTTKVIQIEATGYEVAMLLLLRRFPKLGELNARKISQFSSGNLRVALAIAERVSEGESLAQLSVEEIFDKLFYQSKGSDTGLRDHAEVLSLVYSFSTIPADNELSLLSSFLYENESKVFRSCSILLARNVIQERSHWRAILPQAIANKLASSALNNINFEHLKEVFENSGNHRLLMSFAHRLGLLHDHPIAKKIVLSWLKKNGILGNLLLLDQKSMRLLDYISPVVPEALMEKIEDDLNCFFLKNYSLSYLPQMRLIIKLLTSLAYEPCFFEKCLTLLIKIHAKRNKGIDKDGALNAITRMFQPYFSGTHATLDQRLIFMEKCFSTSDVSQALIGFKMLQSALKSNDWVSHGVNEFGARPRDYGLHLNQNGLLQWRVAFLELVFRLATSSNPELNPKARVILANSFSRLWRMETLRPTLIDIAMRIHAHSPWSEGWKAVRSTIYYHYKKKDDLLLSLPASLSKLEHLLKPSNLIENISVYVFNATGDPYILEEDSNLECHLRTGREKQLEKAFDLGKEFSTSNAGISELGEPLFSGIDVIFRKNFGKGLAYGSVELSKQWQNLYEQFNSISNLHKNTAVLAGFIEVVDTLDYPLAQKILDICASNFELKSCLVELHPVRAFSEIDMARCLDALEDPNTSPAAYNSILYRESYKSLPDHLLLNLSNKILSKPNGDEIVLEALSIKLANTGNSFNDLGGEWQRVGLNASILRIKRDSLTYNAPPDYNMENVINAALRFKDNESLKIEWIESIFSVVDENDGYLSDFDTTIQSTATLMPTIFLNHAFLINNDESLNAFSKRHYFVNRLETPPFDKIDASLLVKWCIGKNDNFAWILVADGIMPWIKNSSPAYKLSDTALKLLEASPSPKLVLECFANTSPLTPHMGDDTDERVDIALANLKHHHRKDISDAAKEVHIHFIERIRRRQEEIKSRDDERERKFE